MNDHGLLPEIAPDHTQDDYQADLSWAVVHQAECQVTCLRSVAFRSI